MLVTGQLRCRYLNVALDSGVKPREVSEIIMHLAFYSGWANAISADVIAKDVFAKRCSGCHAPDSDKEGPHLRGVFGRKAGTVPGFQYSDALRNSGIVWDRSLLSKWLENPEALVKGADMEFQITIDDSKAYKKPWTVTVPFDLLPDTELMESICENEKDVPHMVGK